MDRAKTIKVTLVMVIIVALIIGYYVYLTSKNNDAASRRALEKNVEAEMTPVQELRGQNGGVPIGFAADFPAVIKRAAVM